MYILSTSRVLCQDTNGGQLKLALSATKRVNCATMKTRGQRIKARREELGLSQKTLAARCGWKSKSRISNYEVDFREPSDRDVIRIASAMGVSAAWLDYGVDPKYPTADPGYADLEQLAPLRLVPILSWLEAGVGRSNRKDNLNMEHETVITHKNVSADCYALRVKGNAMVSTDGYPLSFCEGQIIIVEPNKKPKDGDFVIARLSPDKEAIFKQYLEDGNKKYLRSLNTQYPIQEITGNEIKCVVVEYSGSLA